MQRVTVAQLKKLVAEKVAVEAEYLKLVHLSKYLMDDKTLGDYGIRNGANLYIVLHLPGDNEKARMQPPETWSVFVAGHTGKTHRVHIIDSHPEVG